MMQGMVVKKSGDKTVAVAVARVTTLPPYGKKTTITTRYLTHDPNNQAVVGEKVTITATRPLSRRKRWVIVR